MAANSLKIFVVDDDKMQREMVSDHLKAKPGYDVSTFETGEEMVKRLGEQPDVIILDYHLNSVNKDAAEGIDVLQRIKKEEDSKTEVIMYSGQDSLEVAVNTMRYGAFDYVVKNETAFHRIDGAIGKMLRLREAELDAARYKRMLYALAFGVATIAAVSIVLQVMGVFDKLPQNP